MLTFDKINITMRIKCGMRKWLKMQYLKKK